MNVVILCGGRGTRLAEETTVRPKPLIEVGGYPIVWHIMNLYGHRGFNKFVLALGYKGDVIRDYFLRYNTANSDLTIDLATGDVHTESRPKKDWKISMIDTGNDTLTAGRLLRLEPYLRSDGTFMLTYGDGLSDIDICKALAFHRSHGKLATITAVNPPARFGTMAFDGDRVVEFAEKPQNSEGWINGGFFIFEPRVFDYLEDDNTVLEESPLERLAADRQLMAYRHGGFWQCMDTLHDKNRLEELWQSGKAPWKVWE